MFETSKTERYRAGLIAVEVLRQAGFVFDDFDVDVEDKQGSDIQLKAQMGIPHSAEPLEDGERDSEYQGQDSAFALGLTAGMMIYTNPDVCTREGCPRGDE